MFVTGGNFYARVRHMSGRTYSETLRHDDRVHRMDIRRDGSAVATASWDNRVHLTENDNVPLDHPELFQSAKSPAAVLAHQESIMNLAFSNDGTRTETR